MAFGHCMFKNILFVPKLPDQGLPLKDQLLQMDIRLDPNGKREDYVSRTSDRLGKRANIFFSQYRCQAYIGRAWQYLVIYLNMPMRQ